MVDIVVILVKETERVDKFHPKWHERMGNVKY